MENRNSKILFSGRPSGAVEVSVLEPLLDPAQEIPAKGAVHNMIAGRAALGASRVELANDASFPIRDVPDEGIPSLL